MASASEAMPRPTIDVPEHQAVAEWADKNDPYKFYGFQTFDTMQFRPEVDKPLSAKESAEFNRRFQQTKDQVDIGNLALSQLSILGHTVRGLLEETQDDDLHQTVELVRTLISSFAADPTSFIENGSDLYLSSLGLTLEDLQGSSKGYDESGVVQPLETKAYAKLALEQGQIGLMRQKFAMEGLDKALEAINRLDDATTLADLKSAWSKLDAALEACPGMDEAISITMEPAASEDLGDAISLKQ